MCWVLLELMRGRAMHRAKKQIAFAATADHVLLPGMHQQYSPAFDMLANIKISKQHDNCGKTAECSVGLN